MLYPGHRGNILFLHTVQHSSADDRSPFSAHFFSVTRFTLHVTNGRFQPLMILAIHGEASLMTCMIGSVDLGLRWPW